MDTINLNLARKWRSKNFDHIVGQDLSLKMLKNSLYLGHYFPVYLLSGTRGCGKTTTARVFAAAVNCTALSEFQKNPRTQAIPCLACASCHAMMQGKHPDFFEIDAASHTGVDTIRQIIDAAQLLPLMGTKKIYLIDEAHMLSKASFNALLKILEEPPRSVLFILATTDDQKIIDTVKSRCFQLFFKPIETDVLVAHIIHICQAEKIDFEEEALELIIEQSQGSARDALNLLEQVRFAHGKISKEGVIKVLGHLDEATLLSLFETVLYKKPAEALHFMQLICLDTFSAESVWQKLAEVARAALWIKHGVQPKHGVRYIDQLKKIVHACPWSHLSYVLGLLYSNEQLFAKTTSKHALLEMILLRMRYYQKKKGNDEGMTGSLPHAHIDLIQVSDHGQDHQESEEVGNDDDHSDESGSDMASSWHLFLQSVEGLKDPLLLSVFRQGSGLHLGEGSCQLELVFPQDLSFFSDKIEESQSRWLPLLEQAFKQKITLKPLFNGNTQREKPNSEKAVQRAAPVIPGHNNHYQRAQPRSASAVREQTVDVTDAHTWPQAHMLMQHFPGTITLVKEGPL